MRKNIEKELYENEMGPYQSVLYGLLELMEEYPRSRPVLAVGQKTLEDRKNYEVKRMNQ